jgi:hypothetical protein
MGRRVLGTVIALILVVVFFAYLGYHNYGPSRAGGNGAVFSSSGAREKVNTSTSKQADDDTVIVYPKQASDENAATAGPDARPANAAPEASAPAAVTNGTGNQITQGARPAPAAAPTADTISPNPPNGMVFAGSGKYQLYRQGNITWRLDTDTGRSCIIFATDEEWKKPRVYRAGCGKS